MTKDTFKEAVSFIDRISGEQNKSKINVTFHGGEPLLAGNEFFSFAIPHIRKTLGPEVNIGIQSNLWLVDESVCKIFKQFHVSVGTSLDGPKKINDAQRCKGYFEKTINGINVLNREGLSFGCISTFTRKSTEKLEEILTFFISNGIHFDVHAAVKPFQSSKNNQFLNPTEFGELLNNLLDFYLKNLTQLKIGTLDTLIKNVANKKSGLCTFSKCLGEYFAISPTGDLYTCNRFVGNKDFCLGNICEIHSFSDITKSAAWKKQQVWHEWIEEECKECLFKTYCLGGCPFAAFSSRNGSFVKDPHCEAYKTIYTSIIDKGAAEFFSEDNLQKLNQPQNLKDGLHFHKNPVLYLMNDKPHPYDLQQTSKKIITAALLGKTKNPDLATKKLLELGIIESVEEKLSIVERFYHELNKPSEGFNNLYLHITGLCNLSCSHCYSYNGKGFNNTNLAVEKIVQLIQDAHTLFFRKVVFTGGEPLLHHDIEEILNQLKVLRRNKLVPKLVLRTNLTTPMNPDFIKNITEVFDKIVVSIDGSEKIHDNQRGQGSFQKTIKNLGLFDSEIVKEKISFACVFDKSLMTQDEIEIEKQSVNNLKVKFPVKEIRFLPLLPLGRAGKLITQRNNAEEIGVSEWLNRKYYFRTSCGIGQSVMVEPGGKVYPCHVLKDAENQKIGNINNLDLFEITRKEVFKQLKGINVNTIPKCMKCDLRFLCGGICSIWSNQDCTDVYNRAKYLLKDALKICNILSFEVEIIQSNFCKLA